jgi:hypothetical protein
MILGITMYTECLRAAGIFERIKKPSANAGFCVLKVFISPSPQQQSHSLLRLLG